MNPDWTPKETPRLWIDGWNSHDAVAVFELLNSPGWKRYIGDRKIKTVGDAQHYIEKKLSLRSPQGHGAYALRMKKSGEMVGLLSLLQRDSLDAPDIGYALLPKYYGQGLAREAAGVLMHHLKRAPWEKVYGITHPANKASRYLLEDLDFQFQGMITMDSESLCCYQHSFSPEPGKGK